MSPSASRADFNGDGALDVATADNDKSDTGLGVRLGRGDGTLAPIERYATGEQSYGVAVADFDGDHRPDLAVANCGSNDVSVLRGRGDGSFEPAVAWTAGGCPADVMAGDVNGDQVPDLVTIDNNSATVTVLLGTGDGRFAAGHAYAVGAAYPQMGILEDLDGDGHLDVATPDEGSGQWDALAVLWGNGDGSFTSPTAVQTAGVWGNQPRGIGAGDLNGDGRPDLVTAGWGLVAVALNSGQRTFAESHTFAAYPGASTAGDAHGVTVLDADGDGRLDVAAAQGGSTAGPGGLAVLHGDGAGGLGRLDWYAIPPTDQNPQTAEGGANAQDVAAGDFDGDGLPDLAVSHGLYGYDEGGVAMLLNAGQNPPAPAPSDAPSSSGAATQPASGASQTDTAAANTAPPSASDVGTPMTSGAAGPEVRRASLGSLRLRRLASRPGRIRVRIVRTSTWTGATTVAVKRRGSGRWHRIARSRRLAFTVSRRARPGRYLVRASFAGVARRISVRVRRR